MNLSAFIDRIKAQPAIVVQLVQVLLGLLVGFEVFALSDDQTTQILAFVAGATGLFLGLSVRPFRWPLVTGFVQAAVTLAVGFGWDATSAQTAAIYAAVAVLGTLVVWPSVTPEVKLPPLGGTIVAYQDASGVFRAGPVAAATTGAVLGDQEKLEAVVSGHAYPDGTVRDADE